MRFSTISGWSKAHSGKPSPSKTWRVKRGEISTIALARRAGRFGSSTDATVCPAARIVTRDRSAPPAGAGKRSVASQRPDLAESVPRASVCPSVATAVTSLPVSSATPTTWIRTSRRCSKSTAADALQGGLGFAARRMECIAVVSPWVSDRGNQITLRLPPAPSASLTYNWKATDRPSSGVTPISAHGSSASTRYPSGVLAAAASALSGRVFLSVSSCRMSCRLMRSLGCFGSTPGETMVCAICPPPRRSARNSSTPSRSHRRSSASDSSSTSSRTNASTSSPRGSQPRRKRTSRSSVGCNGPRSEDRISTR